MTDIETRAMMIRAHNLFSTLTEPKIRELANFAVEKTCAPQELITKEGDVIDAVYLVATGEIEINVGHIPKGLLRSGEAIGLTETGFYSQTGLRTATLKAISNVMLIGWALDTFHAFLQKHPDFRASMKESAEKMLPAYFIKQALPFEELPGAIVAEVAQTMEQKEVQAGTFLFRQDDFADCCYLLCAGEVEIIIKDDEGNTKITEKLRPGQLFGESALLVRRERTASARVSQTAQLLVLKAEQLHRLMRHRYTYDKVMALISKHILPKRAANVEYFQSMNTEGELIRILKDKRGGGYYRLSEEGWLIWQQLDGIKTLRGIVTEIQKLGNFVGIKAVTDAILDLANAGFVSLPELNPPVKTQLDKWRSFKVRIADADPILTRAYEVARLFFSLPGQLFMAGSVITGVIFFGLFLGDLASKIPALSNFLLILIGVFVTYQISGVFHEIAHGFTAKYFDRKVHGAEFVLSWLGLSAFVDTSETWTCPPKSRILVSLSGPYFDLFLAGIASIFALFITHRETSLFLWLFALSLYYRTFANLNPLNEDDGAFVLNDAVDDSILRFNALNWLRNHLPFLKPGIVQLKSNRPEKIYWLTCSGFFILSLIFAFAAQYYLRLVLAPSIFGISTSHLAWILPVLVFGKFAATIANSLRKM